MCNPCNLYKITDLFSDFGVIFRNYLIYIYINAYKVYCIQKVRKSLFKKSCDEKEILLLLLYSYIFTVKKINKIK